MSTKRVSVSEEIVESLASLRELYESGKEYSHLYNLLCV